MALNGIRVIEFAGLAPGPFCGMILADFGANVIRVDRAGGGAPDVDRLTRGKRSIALNLKTKDGVNIIKKLCKFSDVLIEPYRPGIMEKFGLGPKVLMEENPKLIYARLTGYGQTGPYANRAGHDINYISVSGILSQLGRKGEKPYPPLNLVADFAGGGLVCAFGIVAALFERTKSGRGQIIDANMVEGSAYVGSWIFKSQDLDFVWGKPRGNNLLDCGSPIYDTYETSDGKFLAVGALEPQFQSAFFAALKLDVDYAEVLNNPEKIRQILTSTFKTKTRDEWMTTFADFDACVTPVLDLKEAARDPHNVSKNSFIDSAVGPEPKPAPRLSRTPASIKFDDKIRIGQHSKQILHEISYADDEIDEFLRRGIIENETETSNSKL